MTGAADAAGHSSQRLGSQSVNPSTIVNVAMPACRLAVVVMGVSGCGKSSVASGIAAALGLPQIDGDDLHPSENVVRMRSGLALRDDDRWPWLDRIGGLLGDVQHAPAGLVIACSALRRIYRDRIRSKAPAVRFVFLDGTPALVRARLEQRAGHYMPIGLLDSQFRTLERPAADEADVLRLDIDTALDSLVGDAVAGLRHLVSLPRD